MTDLRCRTILPVLTLVSQEVPCLGKPETENEKKEQLNFDAVTCS